MKFRLATESDVPAMLEIERASFSDPWSEDMFLGDIVLNPLGKYLICEDSEEILGYVGYLIVAGECQIDNVAVRPEKRRMGIARAMMEKVFREGESLGVRVFTLEVEDGNHPAIEFYTQMGFEVVGRRKGYYESGADAILMDRNI